MAEIMEALKIWVVEGFRLVILVGQSWRKSSLDRKKRQRHRRRQRPAPVHRDRSVHPKADPGAHPACRILGRAFPATCGTGGGRALSPLTQTLWSAKLGLASVTIIPRPVSLIALSALDQLRRCAAGSMAVGRQAGLLLLSTAQFGNQPP